MLFISYLIQSILYMAAIMYTAYDVLTLNLKKPIQDILRSRWWLFCGYSAASCAMYFLEDRYPILLGAVEALGIWLILRTCFEQANLPFPACTCFIILFIVLMDGISDNLLQCILVVAGQSGFYFYHESYFRPIISLITLISLISAGKFIWSRYNRAVRRPDIPQLFLMMAAIGTDLAAVYMDWLLVTEKLQGNLQVPSEIVSLLITILVYFQLAQLIPSLYLKNIDRDRVRLAELYLEEQRKYYLYLENRERETRKFRHDVRNHLNMLMYLCQRKEYKELEAYLLQMSGKLEMLRPKVHMNCPIAEAIVNRYISEAESEGITIIVKGYFPNDCAISAMDLCTILSNLFSNAMEAVKKSGGHQIILNVRHKQGEIYLQMKNDCAEDLIVRGDSLHTTKMDRNSHGFGLENVRETVQANGGWIRMESSQGVFCTIIELKNQK